MFLAVEGRDCCGSFFVAAHFNEPETLAATGFPIGDYFSALHGAVCAEEFLQSRAIHIVAHVSNV